MENTLVLKSFEYAPIKRRRRRKMKEKTQTEIRRERYSKLVIEEVEGLILVAKRKHDISNVKQLEGRLELFKSGDLTQFKGMQFVADGNKMFYCSELQDVRLVNMPFLNTNM